MTVSSGVTRRVSFTGNGATTTFAVTFPFFEINVFADDVAVSTSAYSISQTTPGTTGSVVFNTAPGSGVAIAIESATTIKQETDYVEDDGFPADTHERALDRLTMALMDVRRDVSDAEVATGQEGTAFSSISSATGKHIKAGETVVYVGGVPYYKRVSDPPHPGYKFLDGDNVWWSADWYILVAMGESNCIGKDDSTDGDKTPDDNVFVFRPDTSIIEKATLGTAPFRVASGTPNNMYFHAAKALRQRLNRPVLIVLYGVVGSEVIKWVKKSYSDPIEPSASPVYTGELYYSAAPSDKRLTWRVETALSLVNRTKVDGVGITQGINNPNYAFQYAVPIYGAWVQQVRDETWCDDTTPIVFTENVRPEQNGGNVWRMDQAQQELVGSGFDQFVGYVSSVGATAIDTQHFTGAGYVLMGPRIADALVSLPAAGDPTYKEVERAQWADTRALSVVTSSGSPFVINDGRGDILIRFTQSAQDGYIDIDPSKWLLNQRIRAVNHSTSKILYLRPGGGSSYQMGDPQTGGTLVTAPNYVALYPLESAVWVRGSQGGSPPVFEWRLESYSGVTPSAYNVSVGSGTSTGSPQVVTQYPRNLSIRSIQGSAAFVEIDPSLVPSLGIVQVVSDNSASITLQVPAGSSHRFYDPDKNAQVTSFTLPANESVTFTRVTNGGGVFYLRPMAAGRSRTTQDNPVFAASANMKGMVPLSAAATTMTVTANRLTLVRRAIQKPITLNELGIYVTAQAGQKVRLGIYNSAANDMPGTLFLDGGELTLSGTGYVVVGSALNTVLPIGTYWFALISDGAPTINRPSTISGPPIGYDSSGNAPVFSLYRTVTYGTLPLTDQSVETWTLGQVGATPLILFDT